MANTAYFLLWAICPPPPAFLRIMKRHKKLQNLKNCPKLRCTPPPRVVWQKKMGTLRMDLDPTPTLSKFGHLYTKSFIVRNQKLIPEKKLSGHLLKFSKLSKGEGSQIIFRLSKQNWRQFLLHVFLPDVPWWWALWWGWQDKSY